METPHKEFTLADATIWLLEAPLHLSSTTAIVCIATRDVSIERETEEIPKGFTICLAARDSDDLWRLIESTDSFTHMYQFSDDLDTWDKQGSRRFFARSPINATDLYCWTWDPPTLYNLKFSIRNGISIAQSMSLNFRPVRKYNFGLNTYFSRASNFLYLVSTCPWDHYEVDIDAWRLTRRSKKRTIPLRDMLIPEMCNWNVIVGDTNGTHASFSEFNEVILEQSDGSATTLTVGDDGLNNLVIVPVNRGLGFELVALAADSNQIYYFKFVKSIWDLLGVEPNECKQVSHSVFQTVDSAGEFDAIDEYVDNAAFPVTDRIVTISPTGFLKFVPESGLLGNRRRLEVCLVDGKQYIITNSGAANSFLLDPSTLKVARVLFATASPKARVEWHDERNIFRPGVSWDHLTPKPLQDCVPYSYSQLCEDFQIKTAMSSQFRTKSFSDSHISCVGMDTWRLILQNNILTLEDAAKVCMVVPCFRKIAFNGTRRHQLRAKFLDLALLSLIAHFETDEETEQRSREFVARANSVLLLLCALRDTEVLILLAESCYFRTRGEHKKDVSRAVEYLRGVGTDSSMPMKITLKGKGQQVHFQLPLE
ncbi:hypothetical protein BC830DRAFT_1094134 [Chytriomyces sp. MP71]|nr:hypothetical protein BC830DRAFT_1094134 [Chytriomyces sp. MP71]